MYQAFITEREAGQRLDKYLHRILPNAGSGFLYKMLRKKNITLNGKKAEGSEKIAVGDSVKIFFAQETLEKFMGQAAACGSSESRNTENGLEAYNVPVREYLAACRQIKGITVLYENDHILIADKPAGVLSQKADRNSLSLNEWLIGYLLEKKEVSGETLFFYKPSVCNRLDRNTSGIVLCAKTLRGAQLLGGLLKDRTLHKYYQLYVKGRVEEKCLIEGYLCKDEKRNKVSVILGGAGSHADMGQGAYIKTAYSPLRIERDKTLLEVELFTGKPHQIRAHLAGIGHPLLGDYKYGDRAWNETYRRKFGVRAQLLHACRVVFPQLEEPFADLSGQSFSCEPPEIFQLVSDFRNCSEVTFK